MKTIKWLLLVMMLLGAAIALCGNTLAEGGIPNLYPYSIKIPLVLGDGIGGSQRIPTEEFEPIPDLRFEKAAQIGVLSD